MSTAICNAKLVAIIDFRAMSCHAWVSTAEDKLHFSRQSNALLTLSLSSLALSPSRNPMATLSKVTSRHSFGEALNDPNSPTQQGAHLAIPQRRIAQQDAHLAPVSESRALSCRGCTSPSMSAVTPLLLLAPPFSAGAPKGLPCRAHVVHEGGCLAKQLSHDAQAAHSG